jgi:hypothetical protein
MPLGNSKLRLQPMRLLARKPAGAGTDSGHDAEQDDQSDQEAQDISNLGSDSRQQLLAAEDRGPALVAIAVENGEASPAIEISTSAAAKQAALASSSRKVYPDPGSAAAPAPQRAKPAASGHALRDRNAQHAPAKESVSPPEADSVELGAADSAAAAGQEPVRKRGRPSGSKSKAEADAAAAATEAAAKAAEERNAQRQKRADRGRVDWQQRLEELNEQKAKKQAQRAQGKGCHCKKGCMLGPCQCFRAGTACSAACECKV